MLKKLRVIVDSWSDDRIVATDVVVLNPDLIPTTYLYRGAPLNLLLCEAQHDGALLPQHIVLDPDFLVDVTSICRCFTHHGDAPAMHLLQKFSPATTSAAILLGNAANQFLDDCVNAGHDAPIICTGETVTPLSMDCNIPMGVMSDWRYTSQSTQIMPGTTIFLYTDGLTEAENINHEQFGEERILDVASKTNTPMPLIEAMTSAVADFVGEAEQSDDLTMLAIKYTKQQLAIRYQNELVITNDVTEVPRLAEFVEEACEAAGFDMATTMQLNLALEEAVVNVIDYGYPAGTKGDIFIEAQANEQRLKFTITDSGVPFDPTAKEEVDTTLAAEDRPIGGLGIHLVRQIMDSINYERLNGHNVLTLRKKIQ